MLIFKSTFYKKQKNQVYVSNSSWKEKLSLYLMFRYEVWKD